MRSVEEIKEAIKEHDRLEAIARADGDSRRGNAEFRIASALRWVLDDPVISRNPSPDASPSRDCRIIDAQTANVILSSIEHGEYDELPLLGDSRR